MTSFLRHSLETLKITANFHRDGLNPEIFVQNSELQKFYSVLTTNVDTQNHRFVSVMEGKTIPVYAVQFHPEKNCFDNNPKFHIPRSLESVLASQYFANFFVSEARKSEHSFASKDEELTYSMDQFVPIIDPEPEMGQTFLQVYVWKN